MHVVVKLLFISNTDSVHFVSKPQSVKPMDDVT